MAKKKQKRKRSYEVLTIIFALIFLITSVLFRVFGVTDLWAQLTGTLLGTIITAIVTVLLLGAQTDKEIGHDCDVGIFEKKQEIYHNFISELEKITQDGKLNVPRGNNNSATSNSQIYDELQHLIYQLGFVQMHAEHDVAEEITEKVGKLVGTLSVGGANAMYSDLADVVFQIVALLRKDLYNSDYKPIDKNKISETLRLAGCFDDDYCNIDSSYDIMKKYVGQLIQNLEESEKKVSITCGDKTNLQECIEKFVFSGGIQKENRYSFIVVTVLLSETKIRMDKCNFVIIFSKEDYGGYWYGFQGSDNDINEKLSKFLPKSYERKKEHDVKWIGLKKTNLFPLGWTTFIPPENKSNEAFLRFARLSDEAREAQIRILSDSILADIKEFEDNVCNESENEELKAQL